MKNDTNIRDNLGWNFAENPLNVEGNGIGKYINYQDESHLRLLDNLKIKPRFLDFAGALLSYPGQGVVGFFNSLYYNN